MARVTPLSHRPQSIGEVGLRAGTNMANQIQAETLKGFNAAFQDITDPIAGSLLASEAQADRMAKFELEKNLPIDQIPVEEGGFNPLSLTKWGRAYDASYNEIDRQLISFKAEQALNENAMLLGRPENQGPGVTAAYAEQSKQIIDAYVSNATPANRADLILSLGKKAATNSFALAETEAAYNRNQIKSQLAQTFTADETALRDAALLNDIPGIVENTRKLENSINSQENLNLITHAEADAMRKAVVSEGRKSVALGQFIQAKAEGRGPEFVAKLPQTYGDYNLTVGEAHDVVKTILNVERIEEQASADYHIMQGLQLESDLAAGRIGSIADLTNYDLTDKQALQYEIAFNKNATQGAANQAKLTQARREIQNGNAAAVDTKIINGMAKSAFEATEAELGRPLAMIEKAGILTGEEGLYPASGVPGLSLGTNVPSFDKQVKAALTSTDPKAMYDGYQVYRHMVINKGKPNTLNLTGDALKVAVTMNSLIEGGVDPMTASQRANATILQRTETSVANRLGEFKNKSVQDRLPRAFKDALDADSDHNPQVYGMFVDQVRVNYADGQDLDDAVDAAAINMRGYKESKYFIPGRLGQLAPEETLPIIAYEFDNQLAGTLQNIINNGGTGAGGVPFEWANPEDAIDLSTLNREDWVDKPLPAVNRGERVFGTGYNTKLPRIKIGNHVSDVYLIAGDRTRFGDNGRPLYQLGYKDKTGYLQPLTDGRGPNSAATFSPVDINRYAPNFFNKYQRGERLRQIKETAERPVSELLNEIGASKNESPMKLQQLQDAFNSLGKREQDYLKAAGLAGDEE